MRRRLALLAVLIIAGVFFSVMRPPSTAFGESISPQMLSEIAEDRVFSGAQYPAVVYIHADWCADCPAMEARLKEPDAASSLKRFHSFQLDATSSSVWPALTSMGIESVPALIVLEKRDARIHRRTLAAYSRMPAAALLSFLDFKP
jgi:thiol:disulfide interchange protein